MTKQMADLTCVRRILQQRNSFLKWKAFDLFHFFFPPPHVRRRDNAREVTRSLKPGQARQITLWLRWGSFCSRRQSARQANSPRLFRLCLQWRPSKYSNRANHRPPTNVGTKEAFLSITRKGEGKKRRGSRSCCHLVA